MKKVFECTGSDNTFIKAWVLSKQERIDKIKTDGIRLHIKSSTDICIDLRDWEAISVINALSAALLEKKRDLLEKKRRLE